MGRASAGAGATSSPAPAPDVKAILARLVDKGRIVAKRAYCDWQRFEGAVTPLHELGVELIEIPDRAHTGKNSADIRLSVDAMEMCLTKTHIDTFAILSGDSDFSPLVSKLREFDKTVIGVGMRESTSSLLAEVCDEFIFYEDIVSPGGIPEYESRVTAEKRPCYKLLLETIDALAARDGRLHPASLLKGARQSQAAAVLGAHVRVPLVHGAAQRGLEPGAHQDP